MAFELDGVQRYFVGGLDAWKTTAESLAAEIAERPTVPTLQGDETRG
jgi:hypothetical protein